MAYVEPWLNLVKNCCDGETRPRSRLLASKYIENALVGTSEHGNIVLELYIPLPSYMGPSRTMQRLSCLSLYYGETSMSEISGSCRVEG